MIVFFTPLFLIFAFLIYILVKPDNRDDRFFIQKRFISKQNLLEILTSLEEINRIDYSREKKKIAGYFADNKLTAQEKDKIEDHLLNSYFLGFQKRFIPYAKADVFLKLVFVATLVFSFVYFNLIIYYLGKSNKQADDEILWTQLIASVILFVVPVIFWFVQLGFLSVLLALFSMLNEEKGAVYRAQVTLDELIKMLKPGGRNTPVKLGRPTMEDWARGI